MPSTNTSAVQPETPVTTEATPGNAPPITRFVAQICYGLLVAGPLFPPLLAVALVLNLLRRGRAKGTWLASHFSRQTKDLVISAGVILLSFLPFALGSGYLLGRMIGAGQLSSDSAETMISLPFLAYLIVTVVFMTRMVNGWRALRQNTGI